MKTQHEFSQVPRADIPRSSFNLSHGLKTTFDCDALIPILVADIIPGDTWNVRASHFCRLSTPLFPIMDNMYLETHFFFVPYRTIWENFEKMHGAQDNPGDSISFTIPICTGAAATLGTLADYMGIPLGLDPDDTSFSALPFRAYRKIWVEWYRDENLQNSLTQVIDNGPDTAAENGYGLAPEKRGKRFDYFTSALPAPQKGTAVSLPLGSRAEIMMQTIGETDPTLGEFPMVKFGTTSVFHRLDADAAHVDLSTSTVAGQPLYADLTGATSASINDIRLAFQTQRLLERDARSGTRYVEALKAHWGVSSPDHRLQRAEFLGGGRSTINVTPVQTNTYVDAPADPLSTDRFAGNLAGYGTASGTHSFSKSFVEHGVVIGLVNVRGDITYSQGLDRMWSKSTRFDFYYPVLSGIGEQSILNKEIWADGSANDELVFGYQERYGEYRRANNRMTSLFRVDATGTLAAWHLSEDFATLPTLGATFITANTAVPLDRAIAVPTEPHFIADFYFDIKAARPMPTYGVPGNLDRL